MNSTSAILTHPMSRIAYLQQAVQIFEFYTTIFVLVPGLILSVLTFFVFMRKRFWENSNTMGFYFATSALLGILATVMGILAFFSASFGNDFHLKSEFVCKLFWVLRPQVIFGAAYFQIFITVDRTLNTLYYNRFQFLKKTKNLVIVTIMIEVAVAFGNVIEWWRFWKYTPTKSSASNETSIVMTCTLPNDLLLAYNLEAILSRIVPSLVNLILNGIIINALFKSKRNVNQRRESRISSRDAHFAYSLIAQNFIYTIVTLPHVVLSSMQMEALMNHPGSDYANEVNVMFNFGVWCSHAFEAMPFFMNLGFNKLFRAELAFVFFKGPAASGTKSQSNSQVDSRKQTIPNQIARK